MVDHSPEHKRKTLFVTVGTTSFDALLQAIDQPAFYQTAVKKGFKKIMYQIGRGSYIPTESNDASNWLKQDDTTFINDCISYRKHILIRSSTTTTKGWVGTPEQNLVIEIYRFKPTLDEDINAADVVISHCGAGTALDLIRHSKKFVMVVNETLSDNHQWELALELKNGNYARVAVPSEVLTTFEMIDTWRPTSFPQSSVKPFCCRLGSLLGVPLI